jgi:hypothetical protein
MRAPTALTLGVAVALSALASAQGRSAQPSASGARRYVAIGCISREGTAAAPRYVLTDPRGDSPTTYRLTGDATLLARHIGHSVEVTGSLESPAPAGRAAATPALKAETIVWLSTTCTPKK